MTGARSRAHARRVEAFVSALAKARPPAGFRNPYRREAAAHNLTLFLRAHDPSSRALLLVGETPGYRGAAVSGVPFCSLAILRERWGDPWSAFGPQAGYREPARAAFAREATATIVWRALAERAACGPLPLTWNAVPFHPAGGTRDSNRALRGAEVAHGGRWLEALLELFPDCLPVGVGHRGHEALHALPVAHYWVRHPARGGKAAFVSGLEALRIRPASRPNDGCVSLRGSRGRDQE